MRYCYESARTITLREGGFACVCARVCALFVGISIHSSSYVTANAHMRMGMHKTPFQTCRSPHRIIQTAGSKSIWWKSRCYWIGCANFFPPTSRLLIPFMPSSCRFSYNVATIIRVRCKIVFGNNSSLVGHFYSGQEHYVHICFRMTLTCFISANSAFNIGICVY